MVCLPENFAFMGATPEETDKMKEYLEGPLMKRYSQIAIDHKVWLSLGGFQEKIDGVSKRHSKHL
jgi:deaminated glutathione amidase